MAFLTIKGAKPFPNCARLQATIQRWVCAAYNEISEWRRRSHQREELARMTRYELRDAGINPTTSRAFASKEGALRHACDLSHQKCVVYYVKGPNEERIDAVAITAWCKHHTTPTKPPSP
jgi:uncharacterized protein YjiS (DUF1127 family)